MTAMPRHCLGKPSGPPLDLCGSTAVLIRQLRASTRLSAVLRDGGFDKHTAWVASCYSKELHPGSQLACGMVLTGTHTAGVPYFWLLQRLVEGNAAPWLTVGTATGQPQVGPGRADNRNFKAGGTLSPLGGIMAGKVSKPTKGVWGCRGSSAVLHTRGSGLLCCQVCTRARVCKPLVTAGKTRR